MPQHITVVAYRPVWEQLFQEEADKIRRILGDTLVEIHHIGSTSVPGLAAKPVVDLMPVVRGLRRVDSQNAAFEAIGYECLGEFGIPGRRFFRKGGMERTHHVHIFGQTNRLDIERHLAVRDYLRTHREAAAQYGRLKSELARQYPYDNDGYCDGKDRFVKELERAALRWRLSGGRAWRAEEV